MMVMTIGGRLTLPAEGKYKNEQFQLARRLVQGKGYISPIGPERDDPCCWYAPGYVGMIAATMWFLGEQSMAFLVTARILNTIAFGLVSGLAFLTARRMFGSRVSWITVLLILLHPGLYYKLDNIWDTYWAMLGGVFCLFVFVVLRPKRPRGLIGAGLACGVAATINPMFTLCYPVWVLYGWWQCGPRHLGGVMRYGGLVLLGFVLAILPWTIRNAVTFGELFYMRGNLGLELWIGNAPWSDGYFLPPHGGKHPVTDSEELGKMVELGERDYFKARGAEVAEWWRHDKGRFVRLTIRRIRWYWFGRYIFPWPTSRMSCVLKFLSSALPTVLGLLGAIVVIRSRRPGLVLVMSVVMFSLVYYLAVLVYHYRLPAEPMLLILGAVGLDAVLPRKKVATGLQG